MALRVPTKNVSLVDLVVDLEKNVTAEEVNDAFRNSGLDGILDVEDAPLVSVDFNTNPNSAVLDAQSTMVMGDNKVKVIAWYDNEWDIQTELLKLLNKLVNLLKMKQQLKQFN